MLVSDLDYSEYLGRLAVGRSLHGTVRSNEAMVCVNEAGVPVPLRVTRLQAYEGLRLVDITEAMPGDIVIIAGMGRRGHRRHHLHQGKHPRAPAPPC